jgi:hypothetical protein
MQPSLFQGMLEVIAAEYEAEFDPQGPHTVQKAKHSLILARPSSSLG